MCSPEEEFTVKFVLHKGKGNKLFSEFYEGTERAGIDKKVPTSTIYICPFCGWNWAEYIVMDERALFTAENKPCPEHGMGSFCSSIPGRYYMDGWPYKMLEREFLISMENPDFY